ncbi:hypothetical protein [Nocardia sp. 348MFTsu5.1]|uniref:hypothetical protein n=1 Tax=Nocardia sp. 348MFTsu5.1 TaxID=1172185 RepID=UPI00035F2DD5|nr:hypothetical protein [Nocardia sp. 348MFTsu5.1]
MKRWAWPLVVVGAVVALVIALAVTYFVGGSGDVAKPSGVKAEPDGGVVQVSWSADSDASSFLLSRGGEVVYSGPDSEFTDGSAIAPQGTTSVEYTVRAVDDKGRVSAPSASATVEVGTGWGLLAIPAQEVSDLLPASPSEEGWNGMVCETSLDALPAEEGTASEGSGEPFIEGGFHCALEVDGTEYDLWTDFYVSPEQLESRMSEIRGWSDVRSTTWQGGRAVVGEPAGAPRWIGLTVDSHPGLYIEISAVDTATTADELTAVADSLPVID